MRVASTLVLNEKKETQEQIRDLQTQVDRLYTCLQGRISFGVAVDGNSGQNIQGRFQQFTTSATPDAENTIAHELGSTPVGFIVLWQSKAGSLYQKPTTGTAWNATNLYLKCNVASVEFLIFVLPQGATR